LVYSDPPFILVTLPSNPTTPARVDLFTIIHKAIRTMLFDLAGQLQTADLSDDTILRELVRNLRQMLVLMEQHAHHEDHRIFPAIEAVAHGATREAGMNTRPMPQRLSGWRSSSIGSKLHPRFRCGSIRAVNFDSPSSITSPLPSCISTKKKRPHCPLNSST
jgi:hypothetical protein